MTSKRVRPPPNESSHTQGPEADEHDPLACITLDETGRICAMNLPAAVMLGQERSEILTRPLTDFLVPDSIDHWNHHLHDGHASHGERYYDLRFRRRDESVFWGRLGGRRITENGDTRGVRFSFEDVTVRKEAEAGHAGAALVEGSDERVAHALAQPLGNSESERFFRCAIDALPSTLCVLDENARIVAVNRMWRQFAAENGSNPDDVSEGSDYLAVCDAASGSTATALLTANAIRDILADRRRDFTLEYECSSPTQQRWFAMTISRFADEGPLRLVLVHEEITGRKRAEAEQRHIAGRLQRLAGHLQTVREEQSARIAREIHDELGGTLTMLKLNLAVTLDRMTDQRPTTNGLLGMVEQVDAAIQTVKRIATELRPAMLDTLGLIATVRWYAGQFPRMTGIAVELDMPEHVPLSTGCSTAVFRIIQEGLTNVAAHSGASKVRITVLVRDGHLIVRVGDNGTGISPDSLRRHESFGVIGMVERAQHLGGRLTLKGTPKGTRLTLRIPLDRDAMPQQLESPAREGRPSGPLDGT